MLDLMSHETDSLTNFKRNTSVFLKEMKESGRPKVLTVNGKAELVVQDAESYQRLLELVDGAEAVAGIRRGLESFERGRGIPVKKAFRDLKRRHHVSD
jgi:PHD/YefM family antitoxin component YafN of YafNO toxin-antitoxin module